MVTYLSSDVCDMSDPNRVRECRSWTDPIVGPNQARPKTDLTGTDIDARLAVPGFLNPGLGPHYVKIPIFSHPGSIGETRNELAGRIRYRILMVA